MKEFEEAKEALDKIIVKARAHLYKPIQIAEILHYSRTRKGFNILDLESYRNRSKEWRDVITRRLVGNVSTSSQKYQDNLFEENAIPQRHIKTLDEINKENDGLVENYIYHKCAERWSRIFKIKRLLDTDDSPLDISIIVAEFEDEPGLKRSIDKIYEIIVYSLFKTIVEKLKAIVTVEIENPDPSIISDFQDFIVIVLGIPKGQVKTSMSASLYRAGVANAADLGIDILTNFGPIVQVKHISLTAEIVEGIVDRVDAEKIIIVCKDEEKIPIQSVLFQIGWKERIQGIITLSDLENWYDMCFSKYKDLGTELLKVLNDEFDREFPFIKEFDDFLKERGYLIENLVDDWKV